MMEMFRHVFGPVNSRRLGRSLGIDLLPHKTCSYDCVYCECGATTSLTITRKEYVPIEEVEAELDQVLSDKPALDYITFAGSGEPTLSLSLGPLIRHLKNRYPWYKVAVLTNGTLCGRSEVRTDLLPADLIIPTIPAADLKTFTRVFRPHESLSVSSITDGLISLRKEYSGQIWAEIFIIPGINTSCVELENIRRFLLAFRPDLIQLNSLDRPGTESWVHPAGWIELQAIRDYFAESGIPVDIAGSGDIIGNSSTCHESLIPGGMV
jgi:wyosine [tRNA(Phe)-imidazoG37] synthetase (radical SAM superfamily)